MVFHLDHEAVSTNGRLIANVCLRNDGQPVFRDRVDLGSARNLTALARQIAERSGIPYAEAERLVLQLADRQTAQRPVDAAPQEAPTDPYRLAQAILYREWSSPDGIPTIRRWLDDFWRWDGVSYHLIGEGEMRSVVTRAVKADFDRLAEDGVVDNAGRKFQVTRRLVEDVLQALAAIVQLPSSHEQPCTIEGDTATPANTVLAMQNGILDVPAYLDGRTPYLFSPTPKLFTTSGLNYYFDPQAQCPIWQQFLDAIWPNDPQSLALLAEWFGYCLLPQTQQQKILMLVGPPRSGKGTLMRVLRQLLGPSNVAGPTLSSLQGEFGLQPLLGKLVAIVNDARLDSRHGSATIIERLLSTSGEDAPTINRKHRSMITTKLNTRVIVVTNELPDLRDASGALANRFIILRTSQSWLGHEDPYLTERLLAEVPGILLWSLEGLRRLQQRGRFEQPASANELVAELRELTSPVQSFVGELCVVEADAQVSRQTLYDAYRSWCRDRNIHDGGAARFGRDLRTVLPGIREAQPRCEGGRARYYCGIRLRSAMDTAP